MHTNSYTGPRLHGTRHKTILSSQWRTNSRSRALNERYNNRNPKVFTTGNIRKNTRRAQMESVPKQQFWSRIVNHAANIDRNLPNR